jgi:hypothetical protein
MAGPPYQPTREELEGTRSHVLYELGMLRAAVAYRLDPSFCGSDA